MPQSSAVLTQMAEGYQPFAQGIPNERPFPLQGLPLVGHGGLGGLAGMALMPQIYRAFGQVGMVPMGVGHDQNVYDLIQRQRFSQAQFQAMQFAADADRASFFQTARGVAAVTGTPFGAEQRRAAHAFAGIASRFAPLMATMMPEFVDQMGGMRGSATVLANRMMDAGRYRIDPVTGRMGMTAEAAGGLAKSVFEDFFSERNAGRQMGVTAGQYGALFEELQRRGAVAGQGAEGDTRQELGRAVEEALRGPGARDFRRRAGELGVDLGKGTDKLSAQDIDKLQLDPAVADKLRSFDTERVKRSLQAYTKTVAAMRDIFGDLGRPNAPMQELVAGLEAMTLGASGQFAPQRLGQIARQTHNLARQTGVTLDNALMLQQHAASRAQQMGVEPIFAVQASQGALAFGGAYRAQGHAAHTAWGAMNADQLIQLDANLRVQAAASSMTNRMATAVRLSETVGGFDKDSDAGRYVAAVRAGLNEFTDSKGQVRSVNLNHGQFMRLLTGATRNGKSAGLSEGDIQNLLGQESTNREYAEKFNLADVTRRAQADELQGFVGNRLQETVHSRLRDQLLRQGKGRDDAERQARAAAAAVSQRASRRVFSLSTEEFANTSTRNQRISDIIADELRQTGQGGVLEGMNEQERAAFLKQTAEQFYGHVNTSIQGSMYRAFQNFQNVHRVNNKGTLDEADRQKLRAGFTGQMQEALAPLGRGSVLQRALDALQHSRADDPEAFQKILAQSLGGVRTDDINRTIAPAFRKVLDQRKAVEKLQDEIANAKGPKERADLTAQLDKARTELTAQARDLAEIGEQYGGLNQADSLQRQDVQQASRSMRSLMEAQNDLVGLRGDFGDDVSDAEVDAVRKRQGGKASRDEAVVALRARRHATIDRLGKYYAAERRSAAAAERAQAGIGSQEEAARAKGEAEKLWADVQKDKDAAQMHAAYKSYVEKHYQPRPGEPKQLDMLQRQELAFRRMVQNRDVFDEDQIRANMEHLDLGSNDAVAKALARYQRQRLPAQASRADVDKVLREHRGTMTREEAETLANARLRARRLGVSEEGIKKYMEENKVGEMEAIADIFQKHAERRFEVTDKDLEENRQRRGYRAPTADEIKIFRDRNKVGAEVGDADVVKDIEKRTILKRRQRERDQNFAAFWGSEEGAAFRERADRSVQDMENTALRLIQTPHAARRLGVRAVEMHKQMQGDVQRLRELALYHAGNDVGRLLAGHFTIDTSTQEGRATAAKVQAEVAAIQRRTLRATHDLEEEGLLPGRRYGLGDEGEARRRVLDRAVEKGEMSRGDADKLMKSDVSPAMRGKIRDRARELGADPHVSAVVGFNAADPNLSEFQRAVVAGVRHGAGNEAEAVGVYGRDRFDKLSAGEREETLKKLRQGTGGDQAGAMRLLGLEGDYDKLSDENQKRVQAVMVGLGSDRHAEQLVHAHLQRVLSGVSDPQERERIRKESLLSGRLGIGSEDWARHVMGLGEDNLPPALREKVRREREGMGDEAEARALLGDKAGDAAQLKQMTYDVGLARRVDAYHEAQIRDYQKADKRLTELAGKADLTDEEKDEKQRLEKKKATLGGTLKEYAAGLGVDKVEDLYGVPRVSDLQKERQEAALKAEDVNADKLARGLLRAFKFRPGEEGELDAEGKKLADLLHDPLLKGYGRHLLESEERLETRAGRGGGVGLAGVDAMVKEYMDVVGLKDKKDREARAADFQKKYGFFKDGKLDAAAFETFERDVQLQTHMGALKIGKDASDVRTDNNEGYLRAAFEKVLHRSQQPGATGQGGQGGPPTHITGRLHVTFDGNSYQGDLSGDCGGTPNIVPLGH